MGVLVYNGMSKATAVPVLRKRFSAETCVEVSDSFWAVDSWIAPPDMSDIPHDRWTKNIKLTDTTRFFSTR